MRRRCSSSGRMVWWNCHGRPRKATDMRVPLSIIREDQAAESWLVGEVLTDGAEASTLECDHHGLFVDGLEETVTQLAMNLVEGAQDRIGQHFVEHWLSLGFFCHGRPRKKANTLGYAMLAVHPLKANAFCSVIADTAVTPLPCQSAAFRG